MLSQTTILESMSSFGERLRAARQRRGLTQQDLGKGLATDGLDASKSVVYGWEKNQHHPRADQLALICSRLACSADWLLLGIDTGAKLSPEAAELAHEIDQFEGDERQHVIRLCKETVQFVHRRSAVTGAVTALPTKRKT
jgi:transcriptional regulator with XRE-family HTH domain